MKPFRVRPVFASVLALALGLVATPLFSTPVPAAEPAPARAGADDGTPARGGKSSRQHAEAKAAKRAADEAKAQRSAQRAEERARRLRAGEPPAAKPLPPAPAAFRAAGGGKSSRQHAQAQAAKEAADRALLNEE